MSAASTPPPPLEDPQAVTREAAAAADQAADSFTAIAGLAMAEVRGALHERLRLFSLEAQRSGLTLVQLLMFAVMAAVLAVTAWLALMGGAAVWLVLQMGWHWGIALVALAVLNLIAAGLLGVSMRGMVRHLGFPATLRQLQSFTQRTRAS